MAQQGYRLVDREKQADLRVSIEADAQDGEEHFDMQTAFLDGSFTVRNAQDQVIFSYTFDHVRGAQLSPEAARANALQKTAQEIEDRVVPRFNRNYLK
ncbi:MAG: hypothetical protein F6K11_38175 [Leptolyngbya sp. SIO3F4]|nr:hypothetical protein [Leptolyngbya sp. SIO3F4]